MKQFDFRRRWMRAVLLLMAAAVVSGCGRTVRPGASPPAACSVAAAPAGSGPGAESAALVRLEAGALPSASATAATPPGGAISRPSGLKSTEPKPSAPEPSDTEPTAPELSDTEPTEPKPSAPEPPETEPVPAADDPDAGSAASVSEYLDAHLADYFTDYGVDGASIGLSYKDGRTGETFSYHGDTRFYAASTIKVAAAMYCYDCAAAGALDLDQCLVYDASKDYEGGSGLLQWALDDGDALPMRRLIDLSILDSDNIAAQMIFRYWREQPEQLSLSTRMATAYGLSYEQGGSVTSDEMLALLERLFDNPEQNPHYDHLKALLHAVHFGGYTTRTLPSDQVMRKYGAYGGARSEIAIVELSDAGSYYYLTCYTDGVAEAESFMAAIGGAIYRISAG